MMTDHQPDEPQTEDECLTAYSAQIDNLHLKPWESPPCCVDLDAPLVGHPDDFKAVRLLEKMLAAGISRWHPDPLKALAEAEKNRAKPRRPQKPRSAE